MKVRLFGAFSALLIAAAMLGSGNTNAATSGLPGTSWWSSFQVQNMGTTSGILVIQAYWQQTQNTTESFSSMGFTLPAGGGLTYNPGFAPTYPTGNRIGFCTAMVGGLCVDALPAGFTGAVVASADVPIVAVGSVNNTPNGTTGIAGGRAAGNYAAFGGDKVAAELFFPLAKNSFAGNTVIYYVQAAGVDASVDITYTMNNGGVFHEFAQIGANRTYLFDPTAAGVPNTGCLPAATSPCLGSARVVARTGVVAGVALEYPVSGTPSAFIGSSRGFVASDYSTKVLAPIFKHDFANNWNGLSLQNTTALTATVNVTLTVARVIAVPADATNTLCPNGTPAGILPGQTYIVQGVKIGPYKQETLSKFRNNLGGMPCGIAAAVVVVSDQPLVAVVNESQKDLPSINPKLPAILSTYNAFNPNNASTLVASPLVKEYFPNGLVGKTTPPGSPTRTATAAKGGTSVSVQNAGTVPATIKVRYVAVSNNSFAAVGTTYTVTIKSGQGVGNNNQQLAPGASYVFNMVSDTENANRQALYQPEGSTMPMDGVNYAVAVISDQPVITLMQEDNKPPAGSVSNDLLNYEGFSQ